MSSSAAAREFGGTAAYGSSPGGGGGAGGKFRNRPYRRSHAATPYDRPPSSVRNFPGFLSGLGQGSGVGNDGWLRRIVDPAQRLIAAGAHKLFASVFQKRLTQPPPPQPSEKGLEAPENRQEAVPMKSSREQQGSISKVEKPGSIVDDSSLVNLEKILKQRTFSKSEIDRLTSLLHARTLDSSIVNEPKRTEVFLPGPRNLKDGSSSILPKADGNERHLLRTPVNVLDADVASPAVLAKAYMGTRASKMGPSDLMEEYLLTNGSQQTPKLPVMSLIPTSSNQRVHENGHITPRSRGRSAIYSMARNPYARVHQTTPLKVFEPVSERADGRPVSPQELEHGRIYGSNALKRRSSIFENDIGSVGPLRRIRHKPNLSYQRNNSLLPSSSAARHLSPLPSADSNRKFTVQSIGNEDVAVPLRNVTSVSLKSTEMSSKILEQLDKIVSPPKEKSSSVVRLASLRDKAPVKLLPSDLHGKALKSLEQIDSSKYLEIAHGNSKLDDSVSIPVPDSTASALQQTIEVELNGLSRAAFASDELPSASDCPENAAVERHAVLNDKVVDLDETIPLASPSSSMNQSFRMSAHEDYIDLDDDDQRAEAVSAVRADNGNKMDSTTMKPVLTEADAKEEPVPVPEVHVPVFILKDRKAGESPFTAISGEKTGTFSFPNIPPTSKNVEPDIQLPPLEPISGSSTLNRQSSGVSSVLTFGKEASSVNEERPAAPAFSFVTNGPVTKDADKFNGPSTTKLETSATTFALQSSLSESSSSFSTTIAGPVSSIAKANELNEVDGKKDASPGVFETSTSGPSAASTTSSTSFFRFGSPSGSAPASHVGFPLGAEANAPPPERPVSSLPLVASSVSGGSDGKLSPAPSATAFAVQAPAIFKFGSMTSTSSETPSVAPVEVQNKGDSASVNAVGNPFSASSSANPSTVSSIFGFPAPASNGTASDKQGSISFGVPNGTSQVPVSTSSSRLSSSTQTVPFQFGSSAPTFSFGLAGTTSASSGSFLFGPTATVKFSTGTSLGITASPSSEITIGSSSISTTSSNLFGSLQTTATSGSSLFGSSAAVKFSTGTSLGITALPSSESTIGSSSSSTTSSNLFGSLQTTASPVFGTLPSSTSPSTGFSFRAMTSSSGSNFGSFGASTSSNGPSSLAPSASLTTNSIAPIFGSGASVSSPAPTFTFGSSTTSSQPTFGNSNPVFSFGQTSTSNNDQMNAEDSMAEDMTPAATPPANIFGQQQQQILLAPPSSNFVFGSSSNPFQFGGQQSFAAPSNPSPFAATGSLDFNASGGSSFSLGTGGGDKSGRKIVKVKHRQRRK